MTEAEYNRFRLREWRNLNRDRYNAGKRAWYAGNRDRLNEKRRQRWALRHEGKNNG
jgi:hypothetical protein